MVWGGRAADQMVGRSKGKRKLCKQERGKRSMVEIVKHQKMQKIEVSRSMETVNDESKTKSVIYYISIFISI